MLTTLRIEHFAIVKHLDIDFNAGMTAFTGETGAGKSIMIDALMLALGGRTDVSVIRPGEDQCDITAGFNFDSQSEPALWLAAHDIPYADNELYLRRIIHAEGRSKSYINGQPFPLQKVKELSEKLVHIHGQHQHQTLMNHQTHRQQLDHYAKHTDLLEAVAHHYKQYHQVQQEIDQLKNQEQHSDKIKLLAFQIEELNALNLQSGELDALHQEHQMLHHAKEYIEHSQQISELLSAEDNPDICSGLNQIMNMLELLPEENPCIKNCKELINGALIQCEEAANEMHQFAERVSLDPERLMAVEERMSTIHHVARKYHVDSHHLVEHRETLQNELDVLHNNKNKLSALEEQLGALYTAYQKSAAQLKDSRMKHAKKLAQELTSIIQQLGMPKGWMELEITPLERIHAHGQDKIEYKVCTNPGMAPDSLGKIASGGELSRISLAIQLITAQRGATPTLLFDEVDVGIGGATAALVGGMLRKLGERLQVFCVTHQPQVAASAHNHFMVQKQSDHQQTFTHILNLKSDDKIDEIARMIGGLKITEQTRSHAKELLQLAHS
jgi:DNA repair protein RecN (Recombination protein N)